MGMCVVDTERGAPTLALATANQVCNTLSVHDVRPTLLAEEGAKVL